MKHALLISVATVMLLAGAAGAALTVHENVPGEKVTYDTFSGQYWYWNVTEFVDQTYQQQLDAIAAIDSYGGITGGWHLADSNEITNLRLNGAEEIVASFATTIWQFGLHCRGRVEISPAPDTHNALKAYYYFGWRHDYDEVADTDVGPTIGAWVTTTVPEPASLTLAAIGMVSLARLRRRKSPRTIHSP